MEKKKVIYVSHCILNTATKVRKDAPVEEKPEERLRKKFLTQAIQNNIHIVQLPCPEHKLYGTERWGHTKEQFDHPHFRKQCREMLNPFMDDLKVYLQNTDEYEVLGILGIDGSPSCGVNFTCSGAWGGELMSNTRLSETLETICRVPERGVMIEVLKDMLQESNITIDFYGLDAMHPEVLNHLLE
ncbi:MAG: hypothetical protein JXO44_12705 [Clostridia bacterium]|nr:hypothetical protein [Clostridia bacterium]